MLPTNPNKPAPRAFNPVATIVRRRNAVVGLMAFLAVAAATLTLIAFARLLPVNGSASHSVDALTRARALSSALDRAQDAVTNEQRTPREAQSIWNDVPRAAAPLAQTEPDDPTELAALDQFNQRLPDLNKLIAEAVALMDAGDPALARSARNNAAVAVSEFRKINDPLLSTFAAQLDEQVAAARVWLALCIGALLVTGLMMASAVFTWLYATHADRRWVRQSLGPDAQHPEKAIEAAQRFAAAIENGPLAAIEWDRSMRCTRWSKGAQQMFGRDAADVTGKRWDQIGDHIHPDDAARVALEIQPLLDGRADRVVITHRNIRADGTVLHCVWYNSVLRDHHGTPQTFIALAHDVTETVAAEVAFHRQADLVQRLTDAAPIGIAAIDATGKLLWVNDTMVSMHGGTREELPSIADAIKHATLTELDGTPIAQEQRPLVLALTKGITVKARDARVLFKGKDKPTDVSITAVPLKDAAGHTEAVIVIHQDIRDRIAAEDERETLTTELAQARRLETVGNLATGIAHDFGNALLAISYSADQLAAANARGTPATEQADQLRKAVAVARDLTDSLIDYAAGRDTAKKPLDIGRFLTDNAKFFSRLLPAHFKLVCTPPPHAAAAIVNAAPNQLRQVLLNLVINARDAMPDGGTLTIAATADTSFVTITVRDTGTGMAPDVADRAFDLYFSTKGPQGTGIGLSTVASIVQQHGGTIDLDSVPGAGSRFTIRLPVSTGHLPLDTHSQSSSPQTRTHHGSITASATPPARRALVVESDDRIRPLVVQALRNSGFTVDAYARPEAALEHFNASPTAFAIAVVELDATGLDGATALRKMRRSASNLPAILLTADPQDAQGHLVDQQTRLLLKPFTVASLRNALLDLLPAPVLG